MNEQYNQLNLKLNRNTLITRKTNLMIQSSIISLEENMLKVSLNQSQSIQMCLKLNALSNLLLINRIVNFVCS